MGRKTNVKLVIEFASSSEKYFNTLEKGIINYIYIQIKNPQMIVTNVLL